MALSPWPTSPVALATATATLKQVLDPSLDDARVQSLGATAAALVEDYAPGAPQAVKDTAVELIAGYLSQSDYGAIRKQTIESIDLEFVTNHSAMFRNCGAAGLLTRWKVRRAGAI